MFRQRPYALSAEALASVGATCRPLALAATALGRTFSSVSAAAAPGVDGGYLPAAEKGQEGASIALVDIRGPLAQRGEADMCALVDGYDWIGARLDAALESDAAGVVLVIDSPGGDASGLVEAVRRMRAAVEASGKPVVAYVDEFAASAAYWIAAGVCDAIYVPDTGRVGSIGCIIVHVDASAAAEKNGLKYTLIRDPGGKAAGSAMEPLSDVATARMQRDVADYSNRFAIAVSERRGLSVAAVRALDADMLAGAAAVAAGLADGVASLEQVVSLVASAATKGSHANMKTPKQALAALLGSDPDAPDAVLIDGASRARPELSLGRRVLSLSGAPDAETAEGTIRAWRDTAGRAESTAAELERVRAATREREAADDTRERVATLTQLVSSGRMTPAEAWADPATGAGAGIAEHFAEMKPKTFRAFAAGRAGTPASVSPAPRPASSGATASADETAEAKRWGVSLESYRESKRRFAEATEGAS